MSNDIKRIQKIQLDILKHFDRLCRSNNLVYFLNYGSLLGAVRHAGFIPWDDDIDVMMPRSDYNKLIQVLESNEHENYQFISMHTDRKYFAPIAKMYDNNTLLIQNYGQIESHELGIYIDIFILDGLPEDEKTQKHILKRSDRLRFLWSLSIRKPNAKSKNLAVAIVKTIISIPFLLIGYRYFLTLLDKHCSKYSDLSCDYLAVICFGEGEREIFKKNDIFPPKSIRFEDKEYLCPNNTQLYLERMYGDYMKIPAEKDRKQHMNTVYFNKDKKMKKTL
jgi:lipopolysaccharide cholinephosphotransferase